MKPESRRHPKPRKETSGESLSLHSAEHQDDVFSHVSDAPAVALADTRQPSRLKPLLSLPGKPQLQWRDHLSAPPRDLLPLKRGDHLPF